jgi:hypothetical protein
MRAALVLVLLSSSCTLKTYSYKSWEDGSGKPPMRGGVYLGPECQPLRKERYVDANKARVFVDEEGRDLDKPLEEQVLRLICVHTARQSGALATQHDRFDDRRYDHLAAAMMVLDCDVSGSCEADKPVAVGIVHGYVRSTDAKKVEAALGELALSPQARAFALQRILAAGSKIAALADGLDRRSYDLYVGVPAKVRAARRAYFKKHADLYARLDAVVEHAEENRKKQRVTKAIYGALEQLRADYLKACSGDDCRYHPFVTEVTRELALLHLAGQDPIGVLAENALLQGDGANRQGYGPSIRRALRDALSAEQDAWNRYQRAKREGVDESAIIASFGGTPPVEANPYDVWQADESFPDFAAAVRDDRKFAGVQATVKDTTPGKGTTRITFSYEEAIYVPEGEAAGITAGESCRAVIDRETRDGLIINCTKNQKLTQLRGHRL